MHIGENGAGKSTRVKLLSGVVEQDRLSIPLAGVPCRPASIVESNRLGVSTAFQELSLAPSLSVAVHLALSRPEPEATGLLSARKIRCRWDAILARYGSTDIRTDDIVGRLRLGVRQRVEIVRALARNPSAPPLGEPTSAPSHRDWLCGLIDQTLGEGVSIFYISRKLDEIYGLRQRCIILRNGRNTLATCPP